MAGVSDSASTRMGMHTEPLTGRDIKTKFSLENEGGFAYHFARDVDFNRRAEIRLRRIGADGDQPENPRPDGYRPWQHRAPEPGRQAFADRRHPQSE